MITTADIHRLHQVGMAEHGHKGSALDPDCPTSCLKNARQAVHYLGFTGEKAQALCLAGHLLYYLVQNHCFTDGNKRVAWLSAMHILRNVRYSVNAGKEEAAHFVLDVANNIISSGQDVTRWLAERLVYVG